MEVKNLREIQLWQPSDIIDKKPRFWPDDFVTEDFVTSTFCVEEGGNVHLHKHAHEENFWYIVSGCGMVRLGERQFDVREGDAMVIPRGMLHEAKACAGSRMRILQVSPRR